VRNDADSDLVDIDFGDVDISEEELTALALAADPDLAVSADDVPFRSLQSEGAPLLPDWYMPVAPSRARRDWRSRVSISIAVGMVLINAFGICVTNGFPQIF
jgi:hypothetical protein